MGQRMQRLFPETINRTLAGCLMFPYIGHGVEPVQDLLLCILEISAFSERPEILPDIFDAVFNLALFMRSPDSTGVWRYAKMPQKIQKGFIETDTGAYPFGYRLQHIIDHHDSGTAAKILKSFQ